MIARGARTFFTGLPKLPRPVQLWVFWLILINGIAIVFWPRDQAALTLAAFLLSSLTLFYLTGRLGMTRLLGASHFWWIPPVILFITQLGDLEAAPPFRIWLTTLIISNSIALLFDIADVIRYLGGNRSEIISR